MDAIQAIQRIGIAKLQLGQAKPLESSQFDTESMVGKKSATKTVSQTDEAQRQTHSPTPQPEKKPIRGDDLRLDLKLSLQEAAFGGEKEFRMRHLEACDVCQEPGFKQNWWERCSVCNGEELVDKIQKLKITIPCGVDNGIRLRVSGEGDAGRNGGTTGDLYAYLFVDEDDELKRNNEDILSTLEITQAQAAAGCKMNIRTIDGFGCLTIPPGTKNGATLRLKNRGVPRLQKPSVRGNHLVTILVK